jgi:hypothetical protein
VHAKPSLGFYELKKFGVTLIGAYPYGALLNNHILVMYAESLSYPCICEIFLVGICLSSRNLEYRDRRTAAQPTGGSIYVLPIITKPGG